MNNLRILVLGGITSYRAMFDWLTPWNLVPTLLISPLCQVLLFAYIGRSAGVGDDEFYVIGNALNYAAIPCLFAMAFTIQGEREASTLAIVLTTPARRLPLFLGRTIPVTINGWAVAMFTVVVGCLLLDTDVPGSAWPLLALVVVATSASCTGLGLAMGAIALRVRQGAVLGNVFFCVLLVFCGVNVAVEDLPAWMAAVAQWLPLTHGIEAAREIANGASLRDVSDLVMWELGIAVLYAVIGLVMLRYLEWDSRRSASLERI